MSQRKPRGVRPLNPSRGARKRRGAWLVAIVAVAVVLGVFASRRGQRPATVAPPSHPADTMTAADAYNRGLRLGAQARHLESLPYFRSAVAHAPRSWTARVNYATTLFNGAQQVRRHLGKDEPATRSSVERVAMIAESIRQTDSARAMASQPGDRALVFHQRGQAFHTFGMAEDALVEFRQAAVLDSSSPSRARISADLERRLRSGGLGQ